MLVRDANILLMLKLQWLRSLSMRKRHVSLFPSSERPALPVLLARSLALARPNC
jgi:hypothetical protein